MFGYAPDSSKVISTLAFRTLKNLVFRQYLCLGRQFAKHCKIAKSEKVNLLRAAHPRFVKLSTECGYLVWDVS